MFKKIDPNEMDKNIFSMIGDQWMLITAGTAEHCNTDVYKRQSRTSPISSSALSLSSPGLALMAAETWNSIS